MPTPVADDFEFIRKRRDEIRHEEPIDRPSPPASDTPPPTPPMQPDYYCE